MCPNKNSTNNILDLTCLKSVVNNEVDEIILPDCLSPDFLLIFSMLDLFNFKVTYVREDDICPSCGGKLHCKEYRPRYPNKMDNVRIKKYKCSCCGKNYSADLSDFVNPRSNYTRNVMHWGNKLSEIGEESYYKKSELFQALFGIVLPMSTVYYHEDNIIDYYQDKKEVNVEKLVEKEELKDKGKYHYDEQFPSVNKESQSRLMIMDSETKYPYDDFLEVATLFDTKTIEKYFHEILDDIPHEVMITDGYSAYPAIIEKFDMIQQRCVFHMMYNVGTEIYPVIRRFTCKNKGQYTQLEEANEKLMKKLTQYQPKTGPITDEKQKKLHDAIKNLENEIRKIKKNIKKNDDYIKELNNYLERISNIFKAETMSLAKGRLSRLTNNTEFLPDCVATSAKRIQRNFTELTHFIENETIPKTNNLIELYFKTTLPRQLKRRYRTIKGLKRRLRIGRIRWIHRVVLNNKTPITKFFTNNTQKENSPLF